MTKLNDEAKIMKQRLDVMLVERHLAETRSKAQAVIMAGLVEVDGRKALKAGQVYHSDVVISVQSGPQYVSRGGNKLASVSEELGLDFNNKTIIDVGSSTGGFTDFMLQNGAKKVYAIDVGNNQLHYRLRNDDRVAVMERTDIRDANLPELADMAVIDISFISLSKVLDSVVQLIKPTGLIVAMAKPQFEADKAIADKYKGVIADETVRIEVLSRLESRVKELGFEINLSKDSEITGPKGNRERFYVIKKQPKDN